MEADFCNLIEMTVLYSYLRYSDEVVDKVGIRSGRINRSIPFFTSGNASKIKPISLESMYQRYLKGELNAKVN